ncbi:hypothetical protein [Rasiella sp. SM2506]|uniref:hypothetical protein n=1 Tax=Rasiella sp. SM2506 TaxID=3423914 RepID=UPI003D7B8B94
MKFYSIILFTSLFLFISCQKDDETVENNSEFATALLKGTDSFVASKDNSEFTFLRATLHGNDLEIMARQDMPNNRFITIRILLEEYAGPGTYYSGIDEDDLYNVSIGFGGEAGISYYSDYSKADFEGFRPGVFTITKDDGVLIEGTFSFIGFYNSTTSVDVTEGKFKMGFGNYP